MKEDSEKVIRSLRCVLTPDEITAKTEILVQTHSELEQCEQQKAATSSMYGGKIKAAREKISELAKHVRERAEYRDVVCIAEHDFRAEVVRLVRTDTGEVVIERPMTLEERQLRILPRKSGDESEQAGA